MPPTVSLFMPSSTTVILAIPLVQCCTYSRHLCISWCWPSPP